MNVALWSHAETISTSFEPADGHTGTSFTVSGTTPGVAADFMGGVAKTVGRPPLYRTGEFSWMIDGGNTGMIEFATPALETVLWAREEAGVGGVIEAFDTAGNSLATFDTTAAFASVQWDADTLGAPIARIAAVNANGGPGNYLLVDDFQFTAVPEPATIVLAGLGLAMLLLARGTQRADTSG